jgi:hypothetical protein
MSGVRAASVHQSRRGHRELPGASVRVRGQNDLSYNPGKPLRLPRDRQRRRPPQFNLPAIVRLLLPIAALAGLGVGVFFGIDALLDDDAPASPAVVAGTAADGVTDVADDADAAAASAGANASGSATDDAGSAAQTAGSGDASVDVVADTAADTVVPTTPRIITPADLDGAPVILERGAARPVPEGSVAAGVSYDASDPTIAFSSIWGPGTVVELTRLPGAPLLSDEEAALFVGKTIRLTIIASGTFPEELQLTPAAYELLAQEREPIIAVRIEAVGAPE